MSLYEDSTVVKPPTIQHALLPKEALRLIPATPLSYIDEFEFYEVGFGTIEAWYAGELVSVWNGEVWSQA